MRISADTDYIFWLAQFLQAEMVERGDSYEFTISHLDGPQIVQLDRPALDQAMATLRKLEMHSDFAIVDQKTYEVLLNPASVRIGVRVQLRRQPLVVKDPENGLTYEVSPPSDAYILFLLQQVAEVSTIDELRGRAILRNFNVAGATAFQAVRQFISQFITLRIVSDRARNAVDLDRFATAFLFQFAYNFDTALVPQRNVDELLRAGRITRVRRGVSMATMDPPRRYYLADLVYHYQLGITTDNAFLEFLSYYHVAEHFFEEIYHEALVDDIKDFITQPSFSYKRKKDVRSLIKTVTKRLQIRDERIVISEAEALRLTLERYIDVAVLREQLDEYDSLLVSYYKSSTIEFADAKGVDFTDNNHAAVIKALSQRIYKVRNAIVHSKESEKARFVPFRDDRILQKEVPLMRFIAERITIGTSSVT